MNGIRKKMAVANGFAAEQCGCIPAAYSHQACERRPTAKETTSKSRTAAASGALGAIKNMKAGLMKTY